MTTIDLATLTPEQGFVLQGPGGTAAASSFGQAVAQAGDLNGDGIGDLVIGAPGLQGGRGGAYVVYGRAGGFDGPIAVTDLAADEGFLILGASGIPFAGSSVLAVGDLNLDGIDDLAIGAPGRSSTLSAVYIVHGQAGGRATPLDLGALTPDEGTSIVGYNDALNLGERIGWSLALAGDQNGDGTDDLVIGSFSNGSGSAWVVYLPEGGLDGPVSLAGLTDDQGFLVIGRPFTSTGWSVAGPGDVNGDGVADLVVSSLFGVGSPIRIAATLVFGQPGGIDGPLDLATLTDAQGVALGEQGLDSFAVGTVTAAGDANGDGIADMLLGLFPGTSGSQSRAYLLFGRPGGFDGPVALNQLAPGQGVAFQGPAFPGIGSSVAAVGDLNGDGVTDYALGSIEPPAGQAATTYVVFGRPGGWPGMVDLTAMTAEEGFRIDGAALGDLAGFSLAAGGDVNGDGVDDLLVGAPGTSGLPGAAYVIYGRSDPVAWLGTAGGETRHGGTRDDLLQGGGGADRLRGNAGDDTLGGGEGADTLLGGDGADELSGGRGADLLRGEAGEDTLTGGTEADTLDGGDGADVMTGGAGFDVYIVDHAGDVLVEDAAGLAAVRSSLSWTLGARFLDLELTGTAAINGTGNGRDNTLTGNAAANRLGGAGADRFRFTTAPADRKSVV